MFNMEATVFIVVLLLCASVGCTQITVHHDCTSESVSEPCMTLDMALQLLSLHNLDSNTTLMLAPGTHIIETFSIVQNLSNLSIIGTGNSTEVKITCDGPGGMAFVNMSGLEISHVTVEGCGTNKTNTVLNMADSFIDKIYTAPPLLTAAITLVSCANLNMSDVTVQNNTGFGMIAINIIGTSLMSGVHFLSNAPLFCVLDPNEIASPGGTGGGAFILYQDYQDGFQPPILDNSTASFLTIEDSNIENNYVCRLNQFALVYQGLPQSISPSEQQDHNITGAGGLTIALVQSYYHMDIHVESCLFRNNSGTYNGAALTVVQFESTDGCHVFVENCEFIQNGGGLVERFRTVALDPAGAFLAVFYLHIPEERITASVAAEFILHQPSTIHAINCTFVDNQAAIGGGIVVISLGPAIGFIQDKMFINNCTMEGNIAAYGPALLATELSYSGFEPGLEVYVTDLKVINNSQLVPTLQFVVDTGTVDINFMNVFFNGSNTFADNAQTALGAFSGIVTMSGNNLFMRNSGARGGAMQFFAESYLLLQGDANVTLIENTGLIAGGGIYVDFQALRSDLYDCFLFFERIDFFCGVFMTCDRSEFRASLNFINNDAPLGKAIYGSALVTCPWGIPIFSPRQPGVTEQDAQDLMQYLNGLDPLVSFDPPIEEEDVVNTIARTILSDQHENNIGVSVMPGQPFTAALGAFDELKQSVPLTIFSQVSPLEDTNIREAYAEIGETDRYLLEGASEFMDVPVRVFGNENRTFNVTITTNEAASVEFTITVFLTNCNKGFRFNDVSHSCECAIDQLLPEVECQSDGFVTYPVGSWVGESPEGQYILHECIQDYCRTMITLLNLSSPNDQCANHRAGLLCGECLPGYSRVFGSSECKVCSSNAYLVLIVLFAFLGILLVVAISVLDITITDGYINGFIFYSNVVSVYLSDFLPLSGLNGAVVFVIIAFLNLDFGIETCFYRGMRQIDAVGLEFVFPFYLGGILLLLTCLSKYSNQNKIWRKFKATHVFATLLLLSYSSLVRTCIEILGVVRLKEPTGTLHYRWGSDPNASYFIGLHGLLATLSIFFLIIFIPLPIFLLFPTLIYKSKRLAKLKPLFDAFVAPFEGNRRFWIGFRLLYRLIIFLFAYVGSHSHRLLLCTIFLVILIILQAYLKPFSTTMRNLVDLSVLLNLTLLSVIALYLRPNNLQLDTDVQYVTVAFASAFGTELLILIIYYIVMAIPYTRSKCEVAKKMIQTKWASFTLYMSNLFVAKGEKKREVQTTEVSLEPHSRQHTSVYLHPRSDSIPNSPFASTEFIAFRESLLDSS